MNQAKRIGILGHYGNQNLGDDLINKFSEVMKVENEVRTSIATTYSNYEAELEDNMRDF